MLEYLSVGICAAMDTGAHAFDPLHNHTGATLNESELQEVSVSAASARIMEKDAVCVIRDPTVTAFDEPTFAKLKGVRFKDGTIAVQGAHAKLFLNGHTQPALIVNDLKHGPDISGTIGLWVDLGTEGYFADLRIRHD